MPNPISFVRCRCTVCAKVTVQPWYQTPAPDKIVPWHCGCPAHRDLFTEANPAARSHMRIRASDLMPNDRRALFRHGRLVAVVERGAAIEDAEIDELVVSPKDYDEIFSRIATR